MLDEYSDDKIEVKIASDTFLKDAYSNVLNQDILLIVASFILVFLYFIFYTTSVLMALISVLIILITLPITSCIIYGMFSVNYFGQIHVPCIYLTLFNSTFNIFILMDAWRQSQRVAPTILKRDDQHGRMAYTVRRATRQMLFTTLTTASCHFSNYYCSPFVPM